MSPSFPDLPALERWLAGALDRERTPERLRAQDLSRMEALAARLDHPERAVPVVHLAGTKGKGTTAAALASILDAAGLRVGLHTSPHLVDLRERVRIGARPAPDALWIEAGEEVARASEGLDPTWFERVTAIAFVAFARAGLDVAVHEVGLGGRFDATNLVLPRVCAITRIARDHVELLGETTAAIAREKAGILKAGAPLVAGPDDPAATEVVLARARELGCETWLLGRELTWEATPLADGVELQVTTPRARHRVSRAGLAGGEPVANLALAIGCAERLGESLGRAIAHGIGPGLSRLRWRGRFDVIRGDPEVVVDGAHEAASARALAGTWRLRRGDARAVLLVALAKDKPLAEVAAALAPLAREVIACRSTSPRAREPDEIAAAFAAAGARASSAPDAASGLARARELARATGATVLATGSLFLAGEVLAALGQDTLAIW